MDGGEDHYAEEAHDVHLVEDLQQIDVLQISYYTPVPDDSGHQHICMQGMPFHATLLPAFTGATSVCCMHWRMSHQDDRHASKILRRQ